MEITKNTIIGDILDRGNEIDVTSLNDGLYILTVAGKYAKFIKKSR